MQLSHRKNTELREPTDNAVSLNVSPLQFIQHCQGEAVSPFCNFEFHPYSRSIFLHLVFHFSSWRLFRQRSLLMAQSCHLKQKGRTSGYFSKCCSMLMEGFSNATREIIRKKMKVLIKQTWTYF